HRSCISRVTRPHLDVVTLRVVPSSHPANLPPFPTRRSSDLATYDYFPQQAPAGGNNQVTAFGWRAEFCNVFSNWEQNSARHPKADRKSTRLNSSHQITSYAVFCFQKKTRVSSQ